MKNPELATAFHHLHHGDTLLRLANAWDAGSARLIESLGGRAIATTSAGVAWTHGFPDGNALPAAQVVATAAAVVHAVRVPVSVDFEAGYSNDPAKVGALLAQLIEVGVVGINLEDGSETPELLAAKIAACRAAASSAGVDLFINARTDVYLRGLVPEADRVRETLDRAARYRAAGASGLFVPAVTEPAQITEIVRGAGLPINALAWPGLPAADELTRLGVRRLSSGGAIAGGAWGRAAALATAFLDEPRGEVSSDGALGHRDLNAIMAR